MPRIDEMPEYRAKLPRNVHDLSHKFGLTATVAHLMPIFHDFLNPGETVELGVQYNLRTQPLQSAAMVDIKGHVEYFFVPINLLYEPFGSMFYNLNDNYSSLYPNSISNPNVQNQLPVIDWAGFNSMMVAHDTDVIGFEQWVAHAYRFLDLLGFYNTSVNEQGFISGSTYKNWNPNVFPYQMLAYHCIYEYYYRLDSREHFIQALFNWDQYYNTPVVTLSEGWYKELFRLRYRPKDSDYFVDRKVSPIVDVLNLNVKSSFDLAQSWLSRESYLNYNGSPNSVISSGGPGSPASNNGGAGGIPVSPSSEITTKFGFSGTSTSYSNKIIANTTSVPSTTLVAPNGFDINTANIRAIFAAEKLHSITGRARKHYDDQTLAHFGYPVPHDVKHEISCFGHDRSSIHIGEVISTAGTTTTPLGEIAGKGYGQLALSPHKFTAPVHGVVMAIMSFVPDITYEDTFIKANAVTDRNSFYLPEYDHLGMQPLFDYETGSRTASSSGVVGWQYRYEQWKRRYNRVTKAFSYGGNLSSWMLSFHPSAFINAPNTDSYMSVVHDPSELNQIMLVNYVNGLSSGVYLSNLYDGDPFVIDAYIHCKKISTMSDYSLPRLDA